jgi:hypothetical protein
MPRVKLGSNLIFGALLVVLAFVGVAAPAAGQVEAAAPALNSNPGAPHVLFLDFDGHVMPPFSVQVNGETREALETSILPFSLDSNPNSLTAEEQGFIRTVWKHVAEDYAPFNINVTTVEPPSLASPVNDNVANGTALRVAIGDFDPQNAFRHEGADRGGYVPGGPGSFTNAVPNAAFVFPKGFVNDNDPFRTGHTASHEAGHAFGLNLHQLGTPLDRRAIMGTPSAGALRTIWYLCGPISGPTGPAEPCKEDLGMDIPGVSQDDVAVLTSMLDARPDDHGTVNSPTLLSLTGVSRVNGITEITLEGSGIIENLNDQDFFSFWAGPGQFTVRADVPGNKVANLDAELELWSNTGGNWTQVSIPSGRRIHVASDLWAGFWHPVLSGEVGEYRVAVKSNGAYGDLGQYTLKVTGEKVNDFSGPRVKGSIANGPRKQFPLIARFATLYAAESLTVEFDRPILGNLAQAISLGGPSGPINVTAVQMVDPSDPRVFEIIFPIQGTPGSYTLSISPTIQSLQGGFLMNQDGDAVNGEPTQDAYTSSFFIRDSLYDYMECEALGLERIREPLILPKWPIEPGDPIIDIITYKDRELTFTTIWKATELKDTYKVTVQVTDDRSLKAIKTFMAKIEYVGAIKGEETEIEHLRMGVDGPHPWEKLD